MVQSPEVPVACTVKVSPIAPDNGGAKTDPGESQSTENEPIEDARAGEGANQERADSRTVAVSRAFLDILLGILLG
jgi:hypothetical protein